jgi:hypothetical protein
VIATAFFIWRLEREQKCLNPKILLQSLKIRVIIYQIHHIQWMDNEVLPQIGLPIVDLLISGGLFFWNGFTIWVIPSLAIRSRTTVARKRLSIRKCQSRMEHVKKYLKDILLIRVTGVPTRDTAQLNSNNYSDNLIGYHSNRY